MRPGVMAHAPQADVAALRIGAVAFIQRLGASLNTHVHFHVCVVDGMFESMPHNNNADVTEATPDVIFQAASGLDASAVTQVQAAVRTRILRAFLGKRSDLRL